MTIPGWVIAAVLLSFVWFFAVRTVLRAVERRPLRSRPSVDTLDRLALLAGPVVWVALVVDAVRERGHLNG